MIETTSGLIGYVDSLDNLADILTDERQQCKIFELCEEFGGWRRCKGDGNCFYRASGFALIEAALCGGDPQSLQPLTDSFQAAAGGDATDLVALLYGLTDQDSESAIELWYSSLLCNADLDSQLVRSVRRVCADWLEANRHRKFSGKSIGDYVKVAHDRELDDFIREEVLADGHEAEQIVIHAATQALGSKLEIIQVYRDERPAQRYVMPDEAGRVTATLLFRPGQPGHYDIFYRRALYEEVTKLQDELQLRRACSQQAVPSSVNNGFNPFPGRPVSFSNITHSADEEAFNPFPGRTASMSSHTTQPVRHEKSGASRGSHGSRGAPQSGSIEEAVGTLQRELDESLVNCVARINGAKDDLASRIRLLDKDKAKLRDLRKEVESLRSQGTSDSEKLRAQQDALSRAQAESHPQAGWWACCICPGPQTPRTLA